MEKNGRKLLGRPKLIKRCCGTRRRRRRGKKYKKFHDRLIEANLTCPYGDVRWTQCIAQSQQQFKNSSNKSSSVVQQLWWLLVTC
jgi:hypothetical protein